MITERDLEAEFAAEEEMDLDLDAEFVDTSPEDDTNIYELRALRLSILLDFYLQDTRWCSFRPPQKCGWHAQEPWYSRMPAIPVAETDQ